MDESLFGKFTELYNVFKSTEEYAERVDQFAITEEFREIIIETLKNEPISNEHLTGLIQMFKFGCLKESFKKYLQQNVSDNNRYKQLLEKDDEINQSGYTGAGMTSINGLNNQQLSVVKNFLKDAFNVSTIEEGISLCTKFEGEKIPYVKSGIYSPWLYYINPAIFPIINNSHIEFRKWIKMPADYPSCIQDFNTLKSLVDEAELGVLDAFTYRYVEYSKLPTGIQILNLKGKRLFKVSHGIFVKNTENRDNGLAEIFEEKKWITIGKGTGKNQASNFINTAQIGDFVYVCYGGDKLYCVAKIISDSQPLDKSIESLIEGGHEWIYREVEPLYFATKPYFSDIKNDTRFFMPSGNSTFYEVPKDNLDFLNENIFIPNCNLIITDKMAEKQIIPDIITDVEKTNPPLNSILYGPPGTGKTYHSITNSVAIIEDAEIKDILSEDRDKVKNRFDQYIENGQITFCTFHQSMGYEDFIEGIKPIPPTTEDEDLVYDVEDGVFKRLCTEAAFSFVQQNITPETEKVLDFSAQFDRYVDYIKENMALEQNADGIPIKTKKNVDVYIDSISIKNNILVIYKKKTKPTTVSKERLSQISQAFPDLSLVSNISDEFRSVIGGCDSTIFWAVLNDMRKSVDNTTFVPTSFPELKSYDYDDKKSIIKTLKKEDYKIANLKRFVLVIDEINRGNVSQVFGELITLIEDDKRLGKDEALKAILPYSKDKFGVPCNLYIIGTMNTADRSVEALDTALRRRFSFQPMLPKPDALKTTDDGINLSLILKVLNMRLAILKDTDHTIGHAWLWNVRNVEQLKSVFANKIIPLLQEYFYNDYEKLGLVLGDSFFEDNFQVNSGIFATFKSGNGLAGQYEQSWQYELKAVDKLTISDFKTLEISNNQESLDEE